MTEAYTVGIWTVKAGRGEEFVAAGRALSEATTAEFPPAPGRLLRNVENPGRFVSFGPLESLEVVEAWRSSAPFKEGVARIREASRCFRARHLRAGRRDIRGQLRYEDPLGGRGGTASVP